MRRRRKVLSKRRREEEEESLFKADAVNEEEEEGLFKGEQPPRGTLPRMARRGALQHRMLQKVKLARSLSRPEVPARALAPNRPHSLVPDMRVRFLREKGVPARGQSPAICPLAPFEIHPAPLFG